MKLRTQLLLGYVLVFAFMVAIAAVTYQRLTSLVTTAGWVSHTHEVISKAHLIEKLLVDMETGERGFLIAGEDELLTPYTEAKERYKQTTDDLKDLVSDNPSQGKGLEEIGRLEKKWHEEAAYH